MDFIIAKFKMVRASIIYKMNLTYLTNLTHFLRGRTFSGREAVPLAPSSFTSRQGKRGSTCLKNMVYGCPQYVRDHDRASPYQQHCNHKLEKCSLIHKSCPLRLLLQSILDLYVINIMKLFVLILFSILVLVSTDDTVSIYLLSKHLVVYLAIYSSFFITFIQYTTVRLQLTLLFSQQKCN